ncbi:hypothetical protein J8F10_07745 [Gemmata sp. G18]|uniref:Uncharacterized protein n=1 Tax=Gemmata palustris TaxID=2822762 RepID=A0ABS5BNB2_9BACT|nr:hypothetical protein [Gemmata palustris]MBP3955172.1 hypothetical protein [Gemmata palustris]
MSAALACDNDSGRGLREWAAEICHDHRNHLRELWFKVVPRGIVICGSARTYYGKQLALYELRRRCSVPVVANQIEVEDPSPNTNVPI